MLQHSHIYYLLQIIMHIVDVLNAQKDIFWTLGINSSLVTNSTSNRSYFTSTFRLYAFSMFENEKALVVLDKRKKDALVEDVNIVSLKKWTVPKLHNSANTLIYKPHNFQK